MWFNIASQICFSHAGTKGSESVTTLPIRFLSKTLNVEFDLIPQGHHAHQLLRFYNQKLKVAACTCINFTAKNISVQQLLSENSTLGLLCIILISILPGCWVGVLNF